MANWILTLVIVTFLIDKFGHLSEVDLGRGYA